METERLAGERGDAMVGRRKSRRERLALLCDVRQGAGGPWGKVGFRDVSQHGIQLGWLPNCRPDDRIWIRLPNLGPMPAHVRWKSRDAVGCEFAQPLHPAVFEHLVAEAKRQS